MYNKSQPAQLTQKRDLRTKIASNEFFRFVVETKLSEEKVVPVSFSQVHSNLVGRRLHFESSPLYTLVDIK